MSGGSGLQEDSIDVYTGENGAELIIEGLKGQPVSFVLIRTDPSYTTTSSESVAAIYDIPNYGNYALTAVTESSKGGIKIKPITHEYVNGGIKLKCGNGFTFRYNSHFVFYYTY